MSDHPASDANTKERAPEQIDPSTPASPITETDHRNWSAKLVSATGQRYWSAHIDLSTHAALAVDDLAALPRAHSSSEADGAHFLDPADPVGVMHGNGSGASKREGRSITSTPPPVDAQQKWPSFPPGERPIPPAVQARAGPTPGPHAWARGRRTGGAGTNRRGVRFPCCRPPVLGRYSPPVCSGASIRGAGRRPTPRALASEPVSGFD